VEEYIEKLQNIRDIIGKFIGKENIMEENTRIIRDVIDFFNERQKHTQEKKKARM
jgi:hypothetical protein